MKTVKPSTPVVLLATCAVAALLAAPLTAQANPLEPAPTTRHGTGLALPSPQRSAHSFAAETPPAQLPDQVDLTRWAVAPGDQGQIGSCASWALAYTIAGFYANKLGTPTRLAPMYVYSQTHLSDAPDGGGSYASAGVAVMREQGAATAIGYQPQGDYDFRTPPTAAQRAEAASYRTLGDTSLFSTPAGNPGAAATDLIKTALADGAPVGLGIPVYSDFYSLNATHYDFSLSSATGGIDGYHYLAALGYDRTGVWVENSWGAEWGRRGFAHLGWDFIQADAVEAERIDGFVATTLPIVHPTPTPPPTSAPAPTVAPRPVPTRSPLPKPTPTASPAPRPTPTRSTTPTPAPTPSPTRRPAPRPVVPHPPVPTPTPSPTRRVSPPVAPRVDLGATSLRLTLPTAWSQGRSVIARLRQPGRSWTVMHGASTRRTAQHLRPGTAYRLQVLVKQSGGTRTVLDRSVRTDPNPLSHLHARTAGARTTLTWRTAHAIAGHVHRYALQVLRGTTVVRVVHSSRTTARTHSLTVSRLPAGRYRFRIVAEVDANERPSSAVYHRIR